MPISYDQRSRDLAEYFLSDDERWLKLPPELREERAGALAQAVQTAVEDFLEFELGEE